MGSAALLRGALQAQAQEATQSADGKMSPREARPWFEVADEVKETRRLLETGTMTAMCAALEDDEWERLLALMENADDFS